MLSYLAIMSTIIVTDVSWVQCAMERMIMVKNESVWAEKVLSKNPD